MSPAKPDTFTVDVQQAVETSLLAFLRKGDWLTMDYGQKIQVPRDRLREIYDGIDFARVVPKISERVEDHIAGVLFNALATEIATDVKQILSNRELREDVRAIIREKIRSATAALVKVAP